MEYKSPYDFSEIRRSLRPGQIYLTFTGDPNVPYCFAKIVSIDENDDLWVKLYYDQFSDRPARFDPTDLPGGFKIVRITVDMFLGWGPPKFPIFVTDETVTDAELSERSQYWPKKNA